MSRQADSGKIDLAEVFRRVQTEMVSQLSASNLIEHAITQGAASEQDWLRLLDLYLPKRYRAAPAFVVNSDGCRSRQIDIAIFDNFSSPLLFPHHSALHIPVEGVYAVLEVKSILTAPSLKDAGEKVASVRALRTGKPRQILGVVLAATAQWSKDIFSPTLAGNLRLMTPSHKLDLGCALDSASFEYDGDVTLSEAGDALIFFLLRLMNRLDALGPAPRVDLMRYAHGVTAHVEPPPPSGQPKKRQRRPKQHK